MIESVNSISKTSFTKGKVKMNQEKLYQKMLTLDEKHKEKLLNLAFQLFKDLQTKEAYFFRNYIKILSDIKEQTSQSTKRYVKKQCGRLHRDLVVGG